MTKIARPNRLQLWLQWIAANALGKLIGLGTVSIVGLFVASKLAKSVGIVPTVSFALLLIVLGAFEDG